MNKIPNTYAESITGLTALQQLYQSLPDTLSSKTFIEAALKILNAKIYIKHGELNHIPESGPTLIIANHPFGAIEGVIIANLLLKRRPDVKIMANYLLNRIPELEDLFIAVNPFGGTNAIKQNILPIKQSLRWLQKGGLLLIFPAGEVSHFNWREHTVTDPKWNPIVSTLIKHTKPTTVPIYFHGSNPLPFQLAGFIHPRLRTFMLPRQLLNKTGESIPITIGEAIHYKRLQHLETPDALTKYLRIRTYSLDETSKVRNKTKKSIIKLNLLNYQNQSQPVSQKIIEPINPTLIAAELSVLPSNQLLINSGQYQVFYAKSAQIPHTLQELGRLREITFRKTGEGTEKTSDIDLFDTYYLQLFVWNSEKQEIVGGYRLGLTDQIIDIYGLKGLYTHTLFKFRSAIINKIYPAIELGRSFVRPEYQKNFSPLMLLWKGIGSFVVKHPGYRILFGPVSISNDYATVSRQILVDFLRANNFNTECAHLVKPRAPFKSRCKTSWNTFDLKILSDIDEISDILSQFETDGKGVPILIKQYLKLGGTFLGFNVDAQFKNTLDGLIMVDLIHTQDNMLQKYLGREGSRLFLDYHHHKNNQIIRRVS